jgi:hypothetical protein
MAFTPFQGSDGRLKAIKIVADLTVPAPALGAGTTVAVSGLTEWAIEIEDAHGEAIHHFESAATTDGMLWGQQINGGTQVWKSPITGYFDGDSASTYAAYLIWNNGCWVKADFVLDKAVGTGLYACQAKISQYKLLGPKVKGGPVFFSAVLLGHGALPALSVS